MGGGTGNFVDGGTVLHGVGGPPHTPSYLKTLQTMFYFIIFITMLYFIIFIIIKEVLFLLKTNFLLNLWSKFRQYWVMWVACFCMSING